MSIDETRRPVPPPNAVESPADHAAAARLHRVRAREVAALAFAPLQSIPAQREPLPIELRPAG